jgi:hypothetical protein
MCLCVQLILCYSLLLLTWDLIIFIPLWFCLSSPSLYKIPLNIFSSAGLVSCIGLVSVYHGRFLFLLQLWMIALLGSVVKVWNYFLAMLEIPQSMPFLLLRFLLRYLLLFWWFGSWWFSFAAFNILSFFSVLSVLIIMLHVLTIRCPVCLVS